MFLLSTRFLSRLRFALLTATVLFVLGLNHQTVTTFRVVPSKTTRVGMRPKAAVIKQKVNLEAVGPLVLHVAPNADAWLPFPTPQHWLPAVRRMLTVPRPLAGVLPSSIFRVRLLVAALSPQAP